MNGVYFKAGDLLFLDPVEFEDLSVSTLSNRFDLTDDLHAAITHSELALHGAPLISWLLGRMAYISEAADFPASAIRRDSELGEIRMRFLVCRLTSPIAKLRIGMANGKTEFSGKAKSAVDASQLLNGFLAAMLSDVGRTMPIRVTATAAELGGYRNEYGIADGQLLGAANIYE